MRQRSSFGGLLLAALLVCGLTAAARAQDTGEDLEAQKQKVAELLKAQRYVDALPLLEKLARAEPDDATTQYFLGFALLAKATSVKDEGERRALRVRGRTAFLRAKELGDTNPLLDALLQSIPPDGGDEAAFSANAEANRLMREAEGLFGRGELDAALASYQKAFQLDPKIYEAALFSGDVYMHRGDYQQAEVWYQKAIAINPYRETAYRYSATPLMKQKKYDEARDRYVEAYITEPYSNYPVSGLSQWAQATQTRLSHPEIEIPTDVTFDEKGDAKINLDAGALAGGKDDGSFAWISYGATRSTWRKEKFARTFPQEKTYRHSLAEEADALRSVLALAASDKNKKLSPAQAKLKKLDEQGLLEAYILLARPDRGIAQDHAAYLRANRDKLRRYVVEYVLTGGGK